MLYSLLLQDSVALRVEVPGSVRTGERVPVVLRLVNKTERQVTLLLQGRPIVFDVTVAREDGAVVWRRLEGQVSGAILALRVLAPAESLTFEAEWDGRAASGARARPALCRHRIPAHRHARRPHERSRHRRCPSHTSFEVG